MVTIQGKDPATAFTFVKSLKNIPMSRIRSLVTIILIVVQVQVVAQVSVHNGSGTDPNTSSMLDVQATDKGMLVPRVALGSADNASPITPAPPTSLLVFNTATAGSAPNNVTPGYYYWGGSSWIRLMSGNTTPIDGTGAANRVTYWSGATTLTSSGNFLYGATGNLSVYNAEATTGEVRLGAAWGRPGVYATTALNLFTAPSQPIIFGNNNVEYMRLTSTGNLGIGTVGPQAKLHVEAGRIYGSKTTFPNPTAYTDADLVLGSNTDTRNGYGGTNGSHIFLRSSDKSSITALDENNNLGQISYQNLRWTIGENVGWGNQNIQLPILSGTGTRMVTADASGNLGSLAIPGGVLPAGTNGQTLYHNGTSWTATSNLFNDGAQINLGQFTTGNTDEWPYVTWLRNTGLGWDEGLIKGSSARGAWGRTGFGIHMDATRHFGFFSSGWDVLADIEGGTGRFYVKGNTGIGVTNPGARLTVRSGTTDPSTYDDGKTLFASGSFGSGQAYDGGVEFRHDNLSQGIGFGYNTIYQTGTNTDEILNIIARGTGAITLNSYGGATGNVGIGIAAPQSKLHVTGKVNVHQIGAGGGENRFEGMEGPTTANGRAQLVLSSAYSDLIVASSQANDNHGSTVSLVAYDPGNAASYRKWVINQGGWGARSQFLDFGYAVNIPNPHSAINSGNTTMTLDGANRRVGINVISPSSKLEIFHNTAMANGMYDNSNIEVVTNDASNPSIGFHRSGHTATALYHAGYGNNSLRIRNADGLDAALLHEGNIGTYGIQNQNAAAQTANYWISGEGRARVFNFGHDNYSGVSPAFVDGQFYRRDGQAELAVDDLFRIRDNDGTVRHEFNADAGEILLGPNPGWGRYLRIGGNGNQTGEANIAATDGNLHLDSRSGHAIYIQSYSGNNTFINPGTGNVGIGTTAPVGKLHVGGSHANGVFADGSDRPSIAASGVYPQMVMMSGSSGNVNHGATFMIGGYDSGASGAHKHWAIGTAGQNSTFLDIGYHAGTDLNPHAGIRNYNGSTFMTILNTGNVGIGTLAPVDKLDVRSSMSVNEIKFRNLDGGDDSDPYRLRKYQSSGNANELQLHLNDDADERFGIYGYSCSGHGCAEYSGNLYHWFRADGNAFHAGSLGVGTQTPSEKFNLVDGLGLVQRGRSNGDWNHADWILERSGTLGVFPSISFHNPGQTAPQWFGSYGPDRLNAGNCCGGGWVTVAASGFTSISDLSMKKEIQTLNATDLEAALADLRGINSIKYRYNNEVSEEPEPYSGALKREQPHIGFSAQSLPKEVVVDDLTKSAASHDEGNILGYSLNDMDGLLVAGVKALDLNQQEQTSIIERLQNEVSELRQLVQQLLDERSK